MLSWKEDKKKKKVPERTEGASFPHRIYLKKNYYRVKEPNVSVVLMYPLINLMVLVK